MVTMDFQGRAIAITSEGYLIHLGDWSRDLARYRAEVMRIELTPDHWWIIDYVRGYYLEHGYLPFMNYLVEAVAKDLGHRNWNTWKITELFPGGLKTIFKIAGVPKPVEEK